MLGEGKSVFFNEMTLVMSSTMLWRSWPTHIQFRVFFLICVDFLEKDHKKNIKLVRRVVGRIWKELEEGKEYY